jgi:hypothetical protein
MRLSALGVAVAIEVIRAECERPEGLHYYFEMKDALMAPDRGKPEGLHYFEMRNPSGLRCPDHS